MSPSFASTWTQIHPPKPDFTEKDLLNLKGKVYIVTGANTGVGKELARMLYSKNAKVYIFARSEDKATKAIAEIKQAAPTSTGDLVFLPVDLGDLTTIKVSAERFLAVEEKLHVLFNNAGVMKSDKGLTKTAQGYETHLGVNAIGTFLFTKFLTPILVATAKSEPPNTVRVVWVSSSGTELFGHKGVGISLDNLDYHIEKPASERYAISKTANWAYGAEFAKRYKADGVISIPLNPGNLTSDLARDQGAMFKLMVKVVAYPPINGAYTELFAGLSSQVTIEKSGDWVIPFGRFYPIRKDLVGATKTKAEGGTGGTHNFWEWTEDQVRPYL
ncbi:NAD(P)-binding protein [Glonium stellatum]|uniref:NAD(P)-binding protein n=1 Tax=Glonium stellatum TaxID=574774 RepID=A0A8E2ETD8_9PEZI|nr:NAD(P)-binding protein [Glonium stellatum]